MTDLRAQLEAIIGQPIPDPEDATAREVDRGAAFKVETSEDALTARLSFDAFCRALVPFVGIDNAYRDGWFLQELRATLEQFALDVAARRDPRLIIMAPPRHGKSVHVELLVAWVLGCLLTRRKTEVMVVGATEKIARDRVHAARQHLATARQLGVTDVGLDASSTAKGDWKTDRGGSAYAAGINGTITSLGADIFVIDDPVKGYADVLSPTTRDKTWRTYTSDIASRVMPGGGVIVIQTRWHEDDLTGRILDQHGHEGWQVIRYPAIAEEDEPHRKAGEPLHPDLWSLERLHRRRASSLTQDWLAQYQQRPSSVEGEVWRRSWFRHWTLEASTAAQVEKGWRALPDEWDRVALACDLTMGSQSGSGSYAVVQTWGQRGDAVYLLDEDRGRWTFEESVERIKSAAGKHPVTHTIIEAKALGIAAIQTLRGQVPRLVSDPAKGSKEMRAHDAAVHLEGGKVYLPDPAAVGWVEDWLDEVTGFPTAKHDDRLDAASMAWRKMLTRGRRAVFAVG